MTSVVTGSRDMPGSHGTPRGRVPWDRLALLWLVGLDLRVGILSLPPLLPEIHQRLGLGPLVLGALTTSPTLLLAVAAVLGSAIVARLGEGRAVALGLFVAAAAGALRAAGPSSWALAAGSIALGTGIAVAQPGVPALAAKWWRERAAVATAVYTNGMIVGEAAAASLTLPLVLAQAGGWQASLAVWSLPVFVGAVAVLLASRERDAGAVPAAMPRRRSHWWPGWDRRETWMVGLVQGAGSVAYFGANAYLPTAFQATGHGALVGAGLSVLNGAQLPASVLVGVAARRRLRPGPLFAGAGIAVLAGALGLALLPGIGGVIGAGLVGAGSAVGFVVALALPPLIAPPSEVAALSAAMFTVGYLLAFLVPLAGGAAWAATGVVGLAFAPIGLGGVGLVVAAGLRRVRDIGTGPGSRSVSGIRQRAL